MGIETLVTGGLNYLGNREAAKGAKAAATEQKAARLQNQANARPYLEAGGNALKAYMAATGLSGQGAQKAYFTNLEDDPAYGRLRDAGVDSIMRRQASLGLSGNQANTLSAISDYSGGLRHQFDQARLSQIGGLADSGRTSAAALAGTNTQGAANQGQFMTQEGILKGAAYNGLGQSISDWSNNATKAAGYMFGVGGNNLSGR
jgi:hypothetical protein